MGCMPCPRIRPRLVEPFCAYHHHPRRHPMTSNRSLSVDWVIVLLFVIAGVLLLTNLNNGYLWQDEAETALLARNTLRFGYPRAVDGRNAIELTSHGYGPGEAWIYNPWLSFYLLAGVFGLIGESTWAARLPFALCGWLSIFLTWRLAVRLTSDRRIQRLSVALLSCSVPFLLHMRQCRYYAMTTALLLGLCLAYLACRQRSSLKQAGVLALMLVLLFHTNFGTFLPALASLIVHQLGWGTQGSRKWFWCACAITMIFTVPWMLLFYRSAFIGAFSLGRMAKHLEYYVRITNKFLFPLACIGMVSTVWWLFKRPVRRNPQRESLAPSTRWLLILLVAAQVLFLLIPDQRHMRYLIPVVPIFAIAEAWWLIAVMDRSRFFGCVIIGLALFTNVLQSVHPHVPLRDFIEELTHRYEGPMEGIVAYLRQHGRSEETVKIPYDDRTLMFYTTMRVELPSQFAEDTNADWVVIRRDWVPSGFFHSDYFHHLESTYERIELAAPDLLWENREDPGSHHFSTVEQAPHVVIYRKPKIVSHG